MIHVHPATILLPALITGYSNGIQGEKSMVLLLGARFVGVTQLQRI